MKRTGESSYESQMSSFLTCLLYTSDAADEEDSVDLGGRRIIKNFQGFSTFPNYFLRSFKAIVEVTTIFFDHFCLGTPSILPKEMSRQK